MAPDRRYRWRVRWPACRQIAPERIDLDDLDSIAVTERELILMRLGQIEDAVAELEAVVSRAPDPRQESLRAHG